MRTLYLPGLIPGTTVQLMLDAKLPELRAAIVHNSTPYAVVWIYGLLSGVRFEDDTLLPGTIDLWLGRSSLSGRSRCRSFGRFVSLLGQQQIHGTTA